MSLKRVQEVEKRGPITKEEFRRLARYLKENGDFIGTYQRYLVDFSTFTEGVRERRSDIRLRITNGAAELVAKSGEWAGRSREEAAVRFSVDQFASAVRVLRILGYRHGVACERKISRFMIEGVEVSLQEVPDHSFFFELEVVVRDEGMIDEAEKKLWVVARRLGVTFFEDDEWYEYIETLNKEANLTFNADDYDLEEVLRKGGAR